MSRMHEFTTKEEYLSHYSAKCYILALSLIDAKREGVTASMAGELKQELAYMFQVLIAHGVPVEEIDKSAGYNANIWWKEQA